MEEERAEHNKLVKASKKKFWKPFLTSLNCQTLVSALYQKMRRTNWKVQRKVNIPRQMDRYTLQFRRQQTRLVQFLVTTTIPTTTQQIDFSSDSTETYDKPFKVKYLDYCLFNTKTTAPGMNQVHWKIIKNTPDTAKQHLASMFFKFSQHTFFPIQ